MGRPIQTRKESHGVSVVKYSPSGDLIWHRDSFHHARFEPLHTPEEAYSYLNSQFGNLDPALSGLPRNDIQYIADITDDVNIDDVDQEFNGLPGSTLDNNIKYISTLNSGIIPRVLNTLAIDYNANRVSVVNTVDDFIFNERSGVVYDRYGNTVIDGLATERYIQGDISTTSSHTFLDNNANIYFVKSENIAQGYRYIDKLSLNREPKSRLFYRGYSTYNEIGSHQDYIYLHGKPLFRWDIVHNSGDGSFFESKLHFYDSDIIGPSGARFKLVPYFSANSGIDFTIYPSSGIADLSYQISSGWIGGNVTVSQLGASFFDGVKFETTKSGIYPFYLAINTSQPSSGITLINDFGFRRFNSNTLDIINEIELGASGYANIHLHDDNIYLYSKIAPYKRYVKLDNLGQIVNSGEYNYVGQSLYVTNFGNLLVVDSDNSVYMGSAGLTKWNSDGTLIWHKGNWLNDSITKCRENVVTTGPQTSIYSNLITSSINVSGNVGVNIDLQTIGGDLYPNDPYNLEIILIALSGYNQTINTFNPYQGNIIIDNLYSISQFPITNSGYIRFVLYDNVMDVFGNSTSTQLGELFQPYDDINISTMSSWVNSLLPIDALITWSGGPIHTNNLGSSATAISRRSTVSHSISRTSVYTYYYNEGSGITDGRPPVVTINNNTVTVSKTRASGVDVVNGLVAGEETAENIQSTLVYSNSGPFTTFLLGEPQRSGLFWGFAWDVTFDTPSYANWTITIGRYGDDAQSSGICASVLCFNKNGDVYWTRPYDIVNPFRGGSAPGGDTEIGINDSDSDEDGNVYCAGTYLNKWQYINTNRFKFNG